MLALNYTTPDRRTPLGAFPHVMQPDGPARRPVQHETPAKKPARRRKTKAQDQPAMPPEARIFLVVYHGDNGLVGNCEIWIRDGKLTSKNVGGIRESIQAFNHWPKSRHIVIGNLIELERSDR